MKFAAPSAHDTPASTRRSGLKRDLTLAILPTVTILLVLALMEVWLKQRLLFASLAASAFSIYIEPHHKNNGVRVLFAAQLGAALVGFGAQHLVGAGYFAAAGAMIVVIAVMVACNAVHPPAVPTALSFAFVPVASTSIVVFAIAVALVGVLVTLQRKADALWRRFEGEHQ